MNVIYLPNEQNSGANVCKLGAKCHKIIENDVPYANSVVNTTRHPLRILSATRLLQKKYGEGEDRTHDLLAGKAISEVHFT